MSYLVCFSLSLLPIPYIKYILLVYFSLYLFNHHLFFFYFRFSFAYINIMKWKKRVKKKKSIIYSLNNFVGCFFFCFTFLQEQVIINLNIVNKILVHLLIHIIVYCKISICLHNMCLRSKIIMQNFLNYENNANIRLVL